MKPRCCAASAHDAIKAGPLDAFLAATVYLGIQDFGTDVPRLALANCPRCFTTLSYPLPAGVTL